MRFVNEYSPQTGIGQGLNNAIASLFSGKAPHDQALDAAHMDAYRATAEHSRAGAAKLQAEADEARAVTSGRQNFLENALALIPGVGKGHLSDVRGYLDTGTAPRAPIESLDEMGPIGVQDAPWFTPTTRRSVDRTAQLAAALLASKASTVEDVAKASSIFAGDVDRAGVLDGSVSPTRFAQSQGKPVSKIEDGYWLNPQDETVEPSALGIADALVGQRESQAGKFDADASLDAEKENTEKARQGNLRASAKARGTAGAKLVPTINEDGDTIWTPVGDAAGERVGAKPGAGATRKPMNKSQSETMAGAIAAHEAELDASLDANTKASVTSRATQLATDPQGEYYQDPAGAVQAAFEEVGEMDVSGRWNPFKANTATAKKKPGAAPAAPAGKPAAAPDRGGKTDQQLLDEANAAIKKGANRDAVMKRLQQMGVKVS